MAALRKVKLSRRAVIYITVFALFLCLLLAQYIILGVLKNRAADLNVKQNAQENTIKELEAALNDIDSLFEQQATENGFSVGGETFEQE